MNILSDKQLEQLKKLKEKQESLTPYLTFELMRKTLGITSNSPLQHLINKAVMAGKVRRVPFGKSGVRYEIL